MGIAPVIPMETSDLDLPRGEAKRSSDSGAALSRETVDAVAQSLARGKGPPLLLDELRNEWRVYNRMGGPMPRPLRAWAGEYLACLLQFGTRAWIPMTRELAVLELANRALAEAGRLILRDELILEYVQAREAHKGIRSIRQWAGACLWNRQSADHVLLSFPEGFKAQVRRLVIAAIAQRRPR